MSTTQESQGKIVQCIGAVIDIQFPREHMPKIYDALQLTDDTSPFAEKGLTFEVEQQLGDGVVRTIAMGPSDGLRRGMKVRNTGAPISVPVGPGTLGGARAIDAARAKANEACAGAHGRAELSDLRRTGDAIIATFACAS